MAKVFTLEANDILKNWGGSRFGGLSGATFTLIHAPTGLEVSASVAMGNYNNGQIIALEAVLTDKLTFDLTHAVAKHLRVSGL